MLIEKREQKPMFTYAALAVVVIALLIYLLVALYKPEWFS